MSFFAYYQCEIIILFYTLMSNYFPEFQFPSLKCNALILSLLIQSEYSMSNTDNHNFYKGGYHTSGYILYISGFLFPSLKFLRTPW